MFHCQTDLDQTSSHVIYILFAVFLSITTTTIIYPGYRNEAHFRALYQRLEKCGTITARRGGLSVFGEETTTTTNNNNNTNDSGDNWVAIQYESALFAQKALCQHGNFVSIGGSTMVMGVMAMTESMDVAAQLLLLGSASSVVGGDGGLLLPSSSSSREGGGVRWIGGSGLDERQGEDSVPIGNAKQRGLETVDDDDELKSSIDNFCGKIMAWFFMWDT